MQLQHQPWRDHHRDEEREQHGGGRVRRDRRHVGPHQAGYEQHRQQRRDHRQRRQDRRIADLGDGLDRRLQPRPAIPHRPVPRDVLHHHDRIVDQNADRENQREQADAVDGVAHDVGGKQRQQDRGGNHHERHHGLAPADRERDQNHDGDGGEAKMEQQLVGLLVGGLAIVARDDRRDIRRDQLAFERRDPRAQFVRHDDRVGAGAFGNRDADGGRRGP